jgi:peptide deformylase
MSENAVKKNEITTEEKSSIDILKEKSIIRFYPHDDLITPCTEYKIPVSDEEVNDLEKLLPDLLSLCILNRGVGLSANQMGKLKCVFVVSPMSNVSSSFFCINPKIVRRGRDIVSITEGCLSAPGVRVLKQRNRVIDVEYITDEGKNVSRTLKSFEAYIFQHEMDHLLGKSFIEKEKESM